MGLKELREKRANLIHEARKLLDNPAGEDGNLNAEQEQQWTRYNEEIDSLGEQVKRLETQEERERELNTLETRRTEVEPNDDPEQRDNKRVKLAATEEYRDMFRRYLRGGQKVLTPNQLKMMDTVAEQRALQADSDGAGGYTVAPEQFVRELIKFVDDEVFVRQLARVFTLENAASLGAPELESDPADAEWQTELSTGTEDSTMDFGKRELKPHLTVKLIKVSRRLLRISAMDIENLVRERLGYKLGITHEKAFMTGSGNNRPLGVFTASAQGISTSRDVSSGNTNTTIGADNLINNKYALKPQYHGRARWIFHRDAVKMIRKLKDGNGDYLWRAGIASDRPDTILDVPVAMSEYAPNTFTTGKYVGIIGDFSNYWIADSLDMEIQRLEEKYADTNQVGFVLRAETDGMPVLEESFSRVTLT